MTKNLNRIVLALCVLVLTFSFVGITADAASDSLVAEIPVKITLEGTLPAVAEVFTVQVKAVTSGAPMPAGASGDLYEHKMSLTSGSGNMIDGMLTIDFSSANLGIYEYSVTQLVGTDPDCYYDESVYNVKVFILNKEDMSGREMHVVITSGEDKPGTIAYENRYANPAVVTVSALKTLNGGIPYSDMFLFQLIDKDGKVVSEVRNDKGTVTFEPMVFGEPEDIGEHVFTMKEVNENAHSITYDKSVYTVTISVSKDENGDYQAKISYKLKGRIYEGTPTFANKQKVPNSPYTGDNLQILLWGGLMIVSAAALIALLLISGRKRKVDKAFRMAMEQEDDSDLEE